MSTPVNPDQPTSDQPMPAQTADASLPHDGGAPHGHSTHESPTPRHVEPSNQGAVAPREPQLMPAFGNAPAGQPAHAAQQGHGHPGQTPQGSAPSAPGAQGFPAQNGPGAPGMMPQQSFDAGAPTHARLPKPLGEEGKNTPIGFGRLVSVELRKMIDTRAGKWLLGGIFGTMLLISVILSIFSSDVRDSPEFGGFLMTSALGLKFMLPIIGVMAVTSEWSQRTGLVTFTMEPRRARVALAKWLAALVLGAAVIVFTVIIAALMTVLVSALGGHDASWSFGAERTLWFVVVFLIFISMGVAFGLLIQNTPAAICAFLFIPIVYSIITGFAQSFGEWTDPNQSLFALLDEHNQMSDVPAKIVVGLLIWLAVPMGLGFMRLTKREVK